MLQLTLGPIGQIARAVKDLAEAERFYRDVLGLPHLFTAGKLAFFDCGGVRLMLEDRSIVDVPDLHNDSVLYFRVPDINPAALPRSWRCRSSSSASSLRTRASLRHHQPQARRRARAG